MSDSRSRGEDLPPLTRRALLRRMCAARLALGAAGSAGGEAQTPAPGPVTGATPPLLYRPADAWVGDPMPFFQDGRYHVFYLRDWRGAAGHGSGTSWYQVSTTDFIHFQDHGEMLPRGTGQDPDLSVATGSVLKAQGVYHAFYTGYSRTRRDAGQPEQSICHAVSDDLRRWRKLPEHAFHADPARYEKNDWRDPFVFWNESAGEYWMLCAARLNAGPARRRGCTALCTSKDLVGWTVREPFYAPGLYAAHECPDLFRLGAWWYLVFSESSDQNLTRYRMSRSLHGPWVTPASDAFDGRDFYAAKTAGEGARRYLFGWNPTRDQDQDDGFWNWGGNLGVHALVQNADGTLGVTMPESLRDLFRTPVPPQVGTRVGAVQEQAGALHLGARESFAAVSLGAMPTRGRIEATVVFGAGTRRCGLLLHSDPELNSAYSLRVEPERGRVVLEAYPRPDSNSPYVLGLERPLRAAPDVPIRVSLLVDGDVCVAYLDGQVALSTRMENLRGGQWGAFVENGVLRLMGWQAFT